MQQWTAFLKLTALKVKPVLFQHLTDIIFRKSLQNHFQTDYLSQQDGTEGVENRLFKSTGWNRRC